METAPNHSQHYCTQGQTVSQNQCRHDKNAKNGALSDGDVTKFLLNTLHIDKGEKPEYIEGHNDTYSYRCEPKRSVTGKFDHGGDLLYHPAQ